MTEALLNLINEVELLRARAILEGNHTLSDRLLEVIHELGFIFHELDI
jgi:hypothetical protein